MPLITIALPSLFLHKGAKKIREEFRVFSSGFCVSVEKTVSYV